MGQVEPIRAVPSTPRISLTLGECLIAESALDTLLAIRLPVKTAYHLAKLARLVKVETSHANQQRETWVKELGDEIEPQVYRVKPDNVQEFNRRMTDLAAVAVVIDWGPLPLSALASVEVACGDLLKLGLLLSDDE